MPVVRLPEVGLGIGRVSAVGGLVTLAIEPAAGELGLVIPRLLPDGEHLVYAGGSPEGGSLYLDSLTTPGRVRLRAIDVGVTQQDRVASLAVAEGFVLYTQGTTLVAHRETALSANIVNRNERDASNWKWVGRWERMHR